MCTEPGVTEQTAGIDICGRGLAFYRQALMDGAAAGEAPECLVRSRLLRSLPGAPDVLFPVPPDVVSREFARPIEERVADSRRSLDALRSALGPVVVAYQEVQQQIQAPIRVLVGNPEISSALEEAVGNCKEELLTAQPGGGRSPALLAEALPRDLALSSRGVRQRTLYQHTVRSHGPTLSYIEQVSEAGAEIRTLNEVFDRMIVCDRSIAFVRNGPKERRASCIAVQHPGLVDYLVTIHQYMWDRAEPVRYAHAAQRPQLMTDRIRRDVIRLTVDGHTDAAIATRLGMSSRTVSSHIQQVAELLGSRSRAHLGFLVAQSGLLDEDTELPAQP